MKNEAGMSLIVKTVTRLTTGLIMIYGVYIILRGHISPGGGFAGGVIIALSFIHLTLAFGKEAVLNKLNKERGFSLMSLGALIYLVSCALSFWSKHQVDAGSASFRIFSPDLLPLNDIAVGLMVGAGLFGIFMQLVAMSAGEGRK